MIRMITPVVLFLATASMGLTSCASTARTAESVPSPQTATAQREIRMDHIAITSMGSGSPVVLIPGLASPRAVWDGIAPDLAKDHRVILVQVNGFGGDAIRENGSPGVLDGIVADLSAYLDANDIDRPAIIGHSMGGLLAMMFARDHDDQVSRVMIVDALPFIGDLFMPGATVAAIEPQAAALRDRIASSPPSAAAAATMSITPAGQQQVAAWTLAANPLVVAQAMYEDMTTDLRPEMAGIATPITLLYPTSPAVPAERTKDLYGAAFAKAPNAKLVAIPGSYHFIMLDQPAAFAGQVAVFLGGQ